jgi:hypothetical protein
MSAAAYDSVPVNIVCGAGRLSVERGDCQLSGAIVS